MAEWAAKLLLEPLISAVNEKASSYLLEQYQVMAGMKEQHAILKRRLPAILDVIVEAEENGAHKKGARAWLEVLKTVAYEANDVFDELKYEALRREAKKKGHYSIHGMDVISLFPAYNPIVFRYRMGKKLRRIVQAIEVLVAEMNAFGFQRVQKEDADKRRSIVKQLRQTDSFISDSKEGKTISRGKDKKEIVKWLLTNPDKMDLMVLPIYGIGGSGKDAQSVYDDQRVKDHFQLRKWVYVSDDFDVDDIANTIIGATGNDCEKALDNLQKEVSGKRFLIVLDDIRKCDGFADKWAKLKTCLQEGGGGSAILTTTHDEEVTQIMCGTDKAHLLAELGKEEIIGREKEEIVKSLLSHADKRELMVLPIFGVGGLGKTTLAHFVYSDRQVKDHFQLQKWVCVSDEFDVVHLANMISGVNEKDREKALKELQEKVSRKRFLVVLDDIWKRDAFADTWAKLKTCLQEGGAGSAILITTRDKQVAEIMCGTDNFHNFHRLAELKKEEIIGRDEEKKKNVESLLSHAGKRELMVLPIFGIGGLGKTTLAQLVYNDQQVKDHFQLQKWVCVSDEFDVVELANKISGVDEKDREKALKELQEKVSRKRFLVVLDDIWKRDAFADTWAKLKTCLQGGGAGSAILITTRDKQVAEIMCGTNEIYPLAGLKKDDLWEIFIRRAFGPEEQKPDKQLVKIGDKIVDRCRGSPLAAKALGSLLSTKRKVTEWEAVLDKSSICNEETGILPILKLSYDNLPPNMKQCFAFCAVFPKDYEIDVEKLILLWIAHDFIPPQEETGGLETIGKQIFHELTSSSFFQEVKQVPFDEEGSKFRFCSRTVCKIHDLMHDVALSVMGKECVTITEELNEIHLPPNATRHLFCSFDGNDLNHCLEKTAQVAQTLLCDRWSAVPSKQHLSKCSSLRALCLQNGLPIRPKHLQHLRYLDLSNNRYIKALPEDISILYHLQTLNISGCRNLRQLPKNMKCMAGLRHLYTNGCDELKCMPPDLGRLTSLQTLTYFVVGASSGCSSIGELQHLNLGGQLELCRLENVTELDAIAGNLESQSDLTQLSFIWKDGCNEAIDEHKKVLGALKPHDKLKVIRVHSYKSTSFPFWMTGLSMLQHLIELHIVDCTMCEKLPQLWHLPALQLVCLQGLDNLQHLCSGNRDSMTSSTFSKLKELILHDLKSFKGWWQIGEQLIFPMLEQLSIEGCSELTTLPLIPIPVESSCFKGSSAHSAFPALKKLKLHDLKRFNGWGAVEGREGELAIFPKLETLSIVACSELAGLPNAQIAEGTNNGNCSAFPVLKELRLDDLERFNEWGAAEGRGEKLTFPLLKSISIEKCPEFTILPEAPKLNVLELQEDKLQMFLSKARHMTSLSNLTVNGIRDRETALPLELNSPELLDGEKKWSFEAAVTKMKLNGCNVLFSSSPQQLPIGFWKCFVHLEDLGIWSCDALVYWPEKALQCFVSLKRLSIDDCRKLTGCAEVEDPEQAAATGNQFPPRLESLTVHNCGSLTELLNLPPSLRVIRIYKCPKLESIWGKQGRRSESTASGSTSAPQPSPPTAHHHLLPSLQHLHISGCDSLVEVLNLPPSLTSMDIWACDKVQFLSGQLDALKSLEIGYCKRLRSLESCLGDLPSLKTLEIGWCKSLHSLPDGPRGYLSLQRLTIEYCPGIKALPKRLNQRLKSLRDKDISQARSK